MDLAARTRDLDRPGVAGRIGVDLEPSELAGVLAAERDHPAVVVFLLVATWLSHLAIFFDCARRALSGSITQTPPGRCAGDSLARLELDPLIFKVLDPARCDVFDVLDSGPL